MTNACRYCHWSSSKYGFLWCTLRHCKAVDPCDKFERAPGSDDE